MSDKPHFKERVPSVGITVILGLVTAGIGVFFLYSLIYGPVGSKPAPAWLLGVIFGLFVLVTVNFMAIRIRIDDLGVRVSYGLFAATLRWSDIVSCEEESDAFYLGWGIRLGRLRGRWVWVYNVIGGRRVALLTKEGGPKGLVFSCRRVEEVMALVSDRIKRAA